MFVKNMEARITVNYCNEKCRNHEKEAYKNCFAIRNSTFYNPALLFLTLSKRISEGKIKRQAAVNTCIHGFTTYKWLAEYH